MPREYSQALADYAISRERYLELKHKCYQYPEWIRDRNDSYELSGGSFDGMPKGSSSDVTSIVERKADKAMKSAELVDVVERCLHDAVDGDIGVISSLRKNVCYQIPYIALDALCGKNQFTKYRHKFYYLLDKKL